MPETQLVPLDAQIAALILPVTVARRSGRHVLGFTCAYDLRRAVADFVETMERLDWSQVEIAQGSRATGSSVAGSS